MFALLANESVSFLTFSILLNNEGNDNVYTDDKKLIFFSGHPPDRPFKRRSLAMAFLYIIVIIKDNGARINM